MSILAWAVAVVVVVGLLVPLCPNVQIGTDADSSWRAVLSWAWVHGAVHGRDVVFTYGPWGFVLSDVYYPGTLKTILAVRLGMVAVFLWGWWALCRRAGLGGVASAGLAVVVGFYGRVSGSLDGWMYAMPLLAVALQATGGAGRSGGTSRERGARWEWRADGPLVGVAVLMSLAGLTKLTVLLPETGAMMAVTAHDLWRRKVPWAGTAFAAGLAGWWLASGQPASAAWPWLRWTWEVASGYDAAMSLSAMVSPAVGYCLFGAGAVAAVATAAQAAWVGRADATRGWAGAAVALVVAPLLLIAFKAGFVRHDWGHEIISTSTLTCVGALLVPVAWWTTHGASSASARRAARGLAVAVLAWGIVAVGATYRRSGTRYTMFSTVRDFVWMVKHRYLAARVLAFEQPNMVADYYRHLVAEMEAAAPLAGVTGTVDVYGLVQARVTQGEMAARYRPRPVFQSYQAYTPLLAELNAAHLRGDRAADSLVLATDVVDGRFPASEESLTNLEKWSRYEPAGWTGPGMKWLWLRRSAGAPREVRLAELGVARVKFGEVAEVPGWEEGPVWVSVRMRKNLWGSVQGTLLKIPEPTVTVHGGTGRETTYRLVPGLGEAGFLLSPVVVDGTDFAATYLAWEGGRNFGRVQLAKGVSFGLTGSRKASNWYEDEVEVRFSRVVMGPVAFPAGVDPSERRALARLMDGELPGWPEHPAPRVYREEDGGCALFAHPPVALALEPTPTARVFRARFGIQREVWEKSKPVRFSVWDPSGERTLWERVLDPVRREADRGTFDVEVRLAEGVGRVELRTDLVEGPEDCWSYWRDVRWE